MSKKSIIIVSVLVAIFVLIGCFFIFRKNILGSKKVSVSQSSDNNKTQEAQNENSDLVTIEPDPQQVLNSNQPADNADIESQKQNTVGQSEQTNVESNSKLSVTNNLVSWGYTSASERNINTIIIHSSYNAIGSDPYNVTGLINEYKQYGVSPHYLVDRKGNIYRLVAEKNIAYHAGEGKTPDGRTDVNNFSIGIELMNQEDAQFTNAQYAALKNLIADIKSRYKIKYVLGHNQIAPGRKTDPWNFEWGKL